MRRFWFVMQDSMFGGGPLPPAEPGAGLMKTLTLWVEPVSKLPENNQ
jgi:hypothetical protein